LLDLNQHDIPAVISNIRDQIGAESDPKKIQMYRTMIGMAEDAYQLKNLDDIMDYDTELQFENKPVYNSETGLVYRNGKIYTTDYNEEETEILVRDIDGVIVDRLSSGNGTGNESIEQTRSRTYKNWDYTGGT
jgi:hypothetical protein